MAFNTRVFGYSGIRQITVVNPHQFSSDSVDVNIEPYAWSQVVSVSASPASTAAQSPDTATFIIIEVPEGSAARYEINPPNRAVVAGNSSRAITGVAMLDWGAGYTVSLVDAATYP